jgi:hypothetical protein
MHNGCRHSSVLRHKQPGGQGCEEGLGAPKRGRNALRERFP